LISGRPLATAVLLLTGAVATGPEPSVRGDAGQSAVQVVADGCPDIDAYGSGTMVAPGRVLTSAHVLAGSTAVTVRRGEVSVAATVVAFDPIADLAVLAVEPSVARVVPLGTALAGDHGVVVAVRAGRLTALPVEVRRAIILQTSDIYRDGVHDRDAFELQADIAPGDSGAAVLVRGRVAAVVFARDRQVPRLAYGLDPAPIVGRIGNVSPVATGSCAPLGT